jgi:large subunit ribosomal protein L23
MAPEQIIKRPVTLTEKGSRLSETQNQYLFEVDRRANKVEIKGAIESLFTVKVEKVRTMIVRGKMRRMGRGYAKNQNWKKAIVSLKEGESIKFLEGV